MPTQWEEINFRNYVKSFSQIELLNICYPDVVEGLQCSPIRVDNNTSFYVTYFPNGDVGFKDFATGPVGNFWKFVQIKENKSFDSALLWVYLRLKGAGYTSLPKIKQNGLKSFKFTLGVSRVNWNESNLEYWKSYGISLATLNRYRVDPIKTIYFYPGTSNESSISVDSNNSYVYKEIKDGEIYLKTYCPLADRRSKWFAVADSKSGVWHGWSQMRQFGELLFIDTSLKDVMVAHETFPQYDSVSMYAETLNPKPQIILELKKRFKKIIIFGDNDYSNPNNPGKKNAARISELFDSKYILIPEKYGCKDRAELRKKVGKEEYIKIINKLINE